MLERNGKLGGEDSGSIETYHRAVSRAFGAFLIVLCIAFLVSEVIADDEIVGTVLGLCLVAGFIVRQVYLSAAGVAGTFQQEGARRPIRNPILRLMAGSVFITIMTFAHQLRNRQAVARSLVIALIAGIGFAAYSWWSDSRTAVSKRS